MNLLALIVPVFAALIEIFRSRKGDIAAQTGVGVDVVGKVGDAVEQFLTKDQQAVAAVMAEVDKARVHDTEMNTQGMPPVVELLRGAVRPLITLTAFVWYVYARAMGVELGVEDYSIIGGILAFWFGFRPFEKVGATSGKGATGGR